jgi:16S rRNA (uracil1498-N3)-methyltransferase
MDFIIQKAVELGVYEIIPFEAVRCVVKLDRKSSEKKIVKWQKVALEAAKQCGRGYVPKVLNTVSFKDALNISKQSQTSLFLYEKEKSKRINECLDTDAKSVAVFIGPEGGFDEKEVLAANENGANLITLASVY